MDRDLDYQFIEDLKNLPFIEEIWLFGPRSRRDHQERSDIDIAILCPKATSNDWMQVNNISTEFYNNILKDKRIIYMKEIQWKDYFYTLGNVINRLKEVLEHKELNQIDYLRDVRPFNALNLP